MTYHPGKPRVGTDPCRPSCPAGDCANCARFDLGAGVPDRAARRPLTVVIDASVVRAAGAPCAMYLQREAFQFLRRNQPHRYGAGASL